MLLRSPSIKPADDRENGLPDGGPGSVQQPGSKTLTFARNLIAAAGFAALAMTSAAHADDGTIKIGILHSLSGTMAISETTRKDAMLMLIDEQNKKSGLLGKKLEAVVVDPASNWPLFAEKARELISAD